MILALTAVLLLQDKSAEETYAAIQKAILDAKTLSVKVSSVGAFAIGDAKEIPVKAAATLLRGKGNRFRGDFSYSVDGREAERVLISDGTTLQIRGPEEARKMDTPANLAERVGAALARSGGYFEFTSPSATQLPRDLKGYTPARLKTVEGDKDLKTLGYQIRFGTDLVEITVSVDPKTFALRKRTLACPTGSITFKIVETYSDFVVDAEIPDAKFKLEEPPPDPEAARKATARADLAALTTALALYELDTTTYPTTEMTLLSLVNKPKNVLGWKGPYLKDKALLLDPWGNSYVYKFPDAANPRGYTLFSCGPDGKPGTADDLRR